MCDGGVRSLEELKLILKQPNEGFDRLVKEADRRSNGDESLRDRILTELVVDNLIRNLGKKEKLPQLVSVFPKKTRTSRLMTKLADPINAVPVSVCFPSSVMVEVGPTMSKDDKGTTDGIGLELGLGPPRKNPNKKRARPKRGLGQIIIDTEEKQKKKKKKRPRISNQEAQQLRERGSRLGLPEDARARMEELGGTDPVLVITKYLYDTDLSTHHARLSLPVRQLADGVSTDSRFLSESEWVKMMGKKEETVKARLVGPIGSDPTEVSIKCWWLNNAPELVITSGWSHFVAKYKNEHLGAVKEGDAVQVWASRCNSGSNGVVLALVVVEPAAG